MIRLLITDLDDTLYPWLGSFVPAFRALLRSTSEILNVPEEDLTAEYRAVHEKLGDVEARYATLELPTVQRKLAGMDLPEQAARLAPALRAYAQVRADRLKLYPDVPGVLLGLRDMGVRIAACTESAGTNSLRRLGMLGARDLFDAVYIAAAKYPLVQPAHAVEKKHFLDLRKPDPAILTHILLDQRVLPEDALYIGDSYTKDICMAAAAGVPCVHIQRKKEDPEHYRILSSISSWTAEETQYEAGLSEACRASGIEADWYAPSLSEIPADAFSGDFR